MNKLIPLFFFTGVFIGCNSIVPSKTNLPEATSRITTNSATLARKSELSKTGESVVFSTNDYSIKALTFMLQDANVIASQLKLDESFPINSSSLIRQFVCPFAMSQSWKAVGSMVTSNYAYFFSKGNKFSYLNDVHEEQKIGQWQEQYYWPISKLDNHSAYQLATQWLSTVLVDVDGLNRECRVHIYARTPQGLQAGANFLPLYMVYWVKKSPQSGSVASVELFAPTKTLLQLRVEDPKYILRPPLEIQNLEYLLSTNTVTGTNAPGSP
jgi:hypothetical protein